MDIISFFIFGLLALPSVLLWVVFWRRRLDDPEPLRVLLGLFILGIASFMPFVLLNELFIYFPEWNIFTAISSSFLSILLFAFLEEAIKALLLISGIEYYRARFDRWEDGFEFAVMVALGFAFMENIFYFAQEYSSGGLDPTFWYVYLFRSIGTMLGHIIFTGTFGYYYACAYVMPHIAPPHKHKKPLANFFRNLRVVLWRPFHITIKHLSPQKDSADGHTSGEIIIEGFLLAVSLHTLFNALLTYMPANQNLSFLTIPLVLWVGWRFATRWHRQDSKS